MNRWALMLFVLSFFIQVQVHAEIGQSAKEQAVIEPPSSDVSDDSIGLDLGNEQKPLPAELPTTPAESLANTPDESDLAPSPSNDVINSVPVDESNESSNLNKRGKKRSLIAKKSVKAGEGFKVTSGECAAYKKMSVGSAIAMTIEAGRKVWTIPTQENQWIQVLRKDGSPAFVKRSCFNEKSLLLER